MTVFFLGGPKAGEEIGHPAPPEAFEFPIFGTNGACNSTARYERIGKTCRYEFTGSKDATIPTEAPPEKAVIIRKPKLVVKTDRPKHGHMEWNEKAGRYTIKEDK